MPAAAAPTSASRLPVSEVKPLKKQTSNALLTFGPSNANSQYDQSDRVDLEPELRCPYLSLSDLTLSDVEATDDNNNEDQENRPKTLPRSIKLSNETQSKIPRPRNIRSTFLPIEKLLSQKSPSNNGTTPRGKRTGTPLQELDRKWALQQCEELTTWTSELLKSHGGQLNQDIRKAISDGVTLPAVIDIVFGDGTHSVSSTLNASSESLTENQRRDSLTICVEYLNSVHCDIEEVSAEELESGDLKAVLTVLSSIKEAMGQVKSKAAVSSKSKSVDQARLLGRENERPQELHISREYENPPGAAYEKVLIKSEQPMSSTQKQAQTKVLTTFRSPLSDGTPKGRPLKSIMKNSVSLDALDEQRPNQMEVGRQLSISKHKKMRKSASNISVNVDSGEMEYHDEDVLGELPPPTPTRSTSHYMFRPPIENGLTVGARSAHTNNRLAAHGDQNSAFNSYSSKKTGVIQEADPSNKRNREKVNLSTLLPMREQPSGDSSPATPCANGAGNEEIKMQTEFQSSVEYKNLQNRKDAPIPSDRDTSQARREPSSHHKEKHHRSRRHQERRTLVDGAHNFTHSTGKHENSVNGRRAGSTSSDKSSSDHAREKLSSHRKTRSRSHHSEGKDKAHQTTNQQRELVRSESIPVPQAYQTTNQQRELVRSESIPVPQAYQTTNQQRELVRSESIPVPQVSQSLPSYTNSKIYKENLRASAEGSQRISLESYTRSPRHQPETSHHQQQIRSALYVVGLDQSTNNQQNTVAVGYQDYRMVDGGQELLVHPQHNAERRPSQSSSSTFSTLTPRSPDTRKNSLMEAETDQEIENYHKLNQPDKQVKRITPAVENSLTETQLRRLSMPVGYQYYKTETKRQNKSRSPDMEQWVDAPYAEDETKVYNTEARLEDDPMQSSFYDNDRSNTPTLPALTDNTDIESVSDVLQNRRYTRSASFSDKLLLPQGSQPRHEDENVGKFVDTASLGNEVDHPSQSKNRKRGSGQSHRRSNNVKANHPNRVTPPDDNPSPMQQKALEDKIFNLEKYLEELKGSIGIDEVTPSHSRRDSITESVTSSQRGYRVGRKQKAGRSADSTYRANQRRFQKIESHIVTLARSVSHISSEMKSTASLYQEMEKLSKEVSAIKLAFELRTLESNGDTNLNSSGPSQVETTHTLGTNMSGSLLDSKDRAQKLNKLTKFFGHEPPLMRLFLKELGYEAYCEQFESEKIGMLELPYMSEDKLKSIGIPLGPRSRILQEAKLIQQNSQIQITNGFTKPAGKSESKREKKKR